MTVLGQLYLDELTKGDLIAINDLFRRIQESLDTIEGTRGNFTRGRWTHATDRISYSDTNDTRIHGFGNV